MKYVDLIIFDLDGTLVDSMDGIVNAINFTLKNLSLKEKGKQEISSYVGRGVEYLIRKSLGNEQDVLLKKALPIYEEYFRKHAIDNSTLYSNVKEALEYFKNKRKIIITNRKRESAILTLRALGVYGYFEDIMGGDDLVCMKPSSCPLEMAVNRLDVNKEKAIIVGDMDIDILAGKRAGVITCGVTYGIGKEDDIIKAKPDFIIDDIIKLKDIIH